MKRIAEDRVRWLLRNYYNRPDDEIEQAMQAMGEIENGICSIGFSADSFEQAVTVLGLWTGWVFDFTLKDGTELCGTLMGVEVDDVSGQYVAVFAIYNEEAGTGDPNDVRRFDIYNHIDEMVMV